MMTELTRYLSTIIDDEVPDDWRWRGRKVKIADGTTVTITSMLLLKISISTSWLASLSAM